jgi:HNH endonuclease
LPPRRRIPDRIRHQVRQQANALCEYCHASEQWQYVHFTIDHVIPLALGGTQILDNLALACFHCNRRKADKATAVDPDSGEEVLLFNPRRDVWSEHFIWSADGLRIVGLTPTGRATIAALALNREWAAHIRQADRVAGRHPPPGDLIQSAKDLED